MPYKILVLLLASLTTLTVAHPGRKDGNGGHHNRKTNEYHCHSEPCFSNEQKANNALQEAKQEKREFSAIYDRDDWPHWIDKDGDCQNERAEALIKVSKVAVKFKRNKGCTVTQGQWVDPYSGQTFTQASKLDIDHIVPLKEAHISGGANWTRNQKRTFANDPINLIVVSAKENRQKGAKDPAQWLPEAVSFHCEYFDLWVTVKAKYGLKMDSKEETFILSSRSKCQ